MTLPRGPFPGEREKNALCKALGAALYLRVYWQTDVLVPVAECYRHEIDAAFARLIDTLERKGE